MEFHLDKDIGTNKVSYFFSILGPRFEVATELMAKSLHKKFGVPFKPIYIFSASPNKNYAQDNYLVLNKESEKIEDTIRQNVIYLQEYEDLNAEFMESDKVSEIVRTLLKKQKTIFVYPFTTSFLELRGDFWKVIGPDPKVAKFYDNKTNHYELFASLNVPRNQGQIYKNKQELLRKIDSLLPCYVTASYTSGGNESGLIYSKEMLVAFLGRIRSQNLEGRFLASPIFEKIESAPNVNAIVLGENETKVLVISDQIMRGSRYLGNIYPSTARDSQKEKMIEVTKKIGDHLSQQGYRGLFGLDFLLNNKGKLVVVDLNPRRQGGYACNLLSLQSTGLHLTDIELALTLNEVVEIPKQYENPRYPGAWGHSKVKPFDPGQKIDAESRQGDMANIFQKKKGLYIGTFYKKGSVFIDGYVGYVVATGNDRKKVYERVMQYASTLLNDTLV